MDITADVESLVNAPTYLLHDVSAACLAELCFGLGRSIQNFLYLYVGSFVGGGLVLSNQLQTGARGSMAAIGSHSDQSGRQALRRQEPCLHSSSNARH